MLRLNEIKLPLDHTDDALAAAVAERLQIGVVDVLAISVFKRSYDARHKSRILLIYQLDVEVAAGLEQALLERFAQSSRVGPSPDTRYRYVAQAGAEFPAPGQQRPIVIGFGPCGILAALLLAHDGGHLVAQALAAARGHEHQRIATRHHVLNDGLLRATKLLVAKNVFQDGMRGRQ